MASKSICHPVADVPSLIFDSLRSQYGHIAKLAGYPNYSRHVGNAMRDLPNGSSVPWQVSGLSLLRTTDSTFHCPPVGNIVANQCSPPLLTASSLFVWPHLTTRSTRDESSTRCARSRRCRSHHRNGRWSECWASRGRCGRRWRGEGASGSEKMGLVSDRGRCLRIDQNEGRDAEEMGRSSMDFGGMRLNLSVMLEVDAAQINGQC